jgi:hypothetical protein
MVVPIKVPPSTMPSILWLFEPELRAGKEEMDRFAFFCTIKAAARNERGTGIPAY